MNSTHTATFASILILALTLPLWAGKHEHKAPHGGTPVVLGDEAYHLELVLDSDKGKMQIYVLDGELEKFIRTKNPLIVVNAEVKGKKETLELHPVANSATGETLEDTSCFEGTTRWLTSVKEFDAVVKQVLVGGQTFRDVKFNFPKGNE